MQLQRLSNDERVLALATIEKISVEVASEWLRHEYHQLCPKRLAHCPACGGELKTWRAKQCLHCGNDWHAMFKVAFLQELGNGRLRIEEQMLKAEFDRRGTPVVLYTLKRIQRRNLPLSPDAFIAGDMDAMHGAMSQLGIDIPAPNDYPDSLAPFLCRRVWKSTLGEVERSVLGDAGAAVFVKPSERRKNFTGAVVGPSSGFMQFGAVSRRQEVWCSDVVVWKSEYRVYVVDDEIVALDHYAGDANILLDLGTVQQALAAYRQSGEAPAAYGIDFGVLETGESALVEANDGYALGAYKVAAKPYTDLLVRRWYELLHTKRHP